MILIQAFIIRFNHVLSYCPYFTVCHRNYLKMFILPMYSHFTTVLKFQGKKTDRKTFDTPV